MTELITIQTLVLQGKFSTALIHAHTEYHAAVKDITRLRTLQDGVVKDGKQTMPAYPNRSQLASDTEGEFARAVRDWKVECWTRNTRWEILCGSLSECQQYRDRMSAWIGELSSLITNLETP
jgi:hypothetical protein